MSLFDDRRWTTLVRRWLTPAGNQVAVSVTAGAATKAVTFARAEQDTAYGVAFSANWLTTGAVTTKLTTGFTITFGTAAPANATVDFGTYRSE